MIRMTILALVILTTSLASRAQVPVRDKNTRREVERLVYKRWEKFRPKWYYALFHGKYDNKDRRIMWQLLPTMGVMDQNRAQTEAEREEMNTIHSNYVTEQLNREAETHYHLHFMPIYDKLQSRYNQALAKCTSAGVSLADLNAFYSDKAMLDNYLKAIREGNLDQGDSSKAMRIIQDDWEKLIAVMFKTARLMETQKKFLAKGAVK